MTTELHFGATSVQAEIAVELSRAVRAYNREAASFAAECRRAIGYVEAGRPAMLRTISTEALERHAAVVQALDDIAGNILSMRADLHKAAAAGELRSISQITIVE